MSLSRETLTELMALADGELEGAAKERAEKLVAESAEARQVVAAVRGPALRVWIDRAMESQRTSSAGIADAVMVRLGVLDERPVMSEAGAVAISAAGARSLRGRVSRTAAASTLAVSVLAMAAAVAVYVRSAGHDEAHRAAAVGHVAMATGTPEATATARAADPAAEGVEVEEVDSPSHVSIFEIPALANASGPSSVVVWIDDESGEK